MRKKASPPRQPSPAPSGLLVIVELGGDWPQLAVGRAATADGATADGPRRVIVQAEGEGPAEFADRVANSLDGLFERGIKLDTVALACNERLDEAAEQARCKLARLALGRMAIAKHMSGHVFLTAPPRSSGRIRHALSALARSLFDEWRTAGLEVSVDFGDESRAAATPFLFTARVA
jgi:hypothetical protein